MWLTVLVFFFFLYVFVLDVSANCVYVWPILFFFHLFSFTRFVSCQPNEHPVDVAGAVDMWHWNGFSFRKTNKMATDVSIAYYCN